MLDKILATMANKPKTITMHQNLIAMSLSKKQQNQLTASAEHLRIF
jgi:hypothetical protein